MVVVLAGYEHDIDELMKSNPGLASRFPETIHFKNLGVDESCVLLESSLRTEYGTELAPEAAAELRELVLPIVQVDAARLFGRIECRRAKTSYM